MRKAGVLRRGRFRAQPVSIHCPACKLDEFIPVPHQIGTKLAHRLEGLMWTLKTQASRTAQAGTPPRKAKAKLERFWGARGVWL